MRSRRLTLVALRERAEQLERERDQRAVIAVADERTRIAREMHDIVAHNLAVMVTLSDAAVAKVAADPGLAAQTMSEVSATGHRALDEMRRLLGVLRTDDAAADRRPQPGQADLDALVARVRTTGLAAELSVSGERPQPWPEGVDLTMFRIVQEALTNTLKHAVAPTRVTVAVGYDADLAVVEVRDDGRSAAPSLITEGLGTRGMRERAALYAGTVESGPDIDGGWTVRARIPLRPAAEERAAARAEALS